MSFKPAAGFILFFSNLLMLRPAQGNAVENTRSTIQLVSSMEFYQQKMTKDIAQFKVSNDGLTGSPRKSQKEGQEEQGS